MDSSPVLPHATHGSSSSHSEEGEELLAGRGTTIGVVKEMWSAGGILVAIISNSELD